MDKKEFKYKYQTLDEFLHDPFTHTKGNVEYDTKLHHEYNESVRKRRIDLKAITHIEGSYYYHITVSSDSVKNLETNQSYIYDVVIRFFTEDKNVERDNELSRYKIQFFSNSPGFIYRYAYLYNRDGYLIKELYQKTDQNYINTPPYKTNPGMRIGYDKSIYFACRYLSDNRFRFLQKFGFINFKVIDSKRFFQNISDFNSVQLDRAIISEEKKLKKIIDQKTKERERKNFMQSEIITRNRPSKFVNVVNKKDGKSHIITQILPKRPTRSTRKP